MTDPINIIVFCTTVIGIAAMVAMVYYWWKDGM